MQIMVTGGAGFIGSNFIHHMLGKYCDSFIVNVDKLTYAGNLNSLDGIDRNRYYFVKDDICHTEMLKRVIDKFNIEYIVHFAAESHVDNSIENSIEFIRSNVLGTHSILDVIRFANKDIKLIYVSTDEVYGMLPLDSTDKFSEKTPLAPNSPYSASKTAGDLLVRSYVHTYGLKAITTHCSNNYGPRQHLEKLIPKAITNIMAGEPIPIYSRGQNIRDWIYVRDHCKALDLIMTNGKYPNIYDIGGDCEKQNIDIAILICNLMEVDIKKYIVFVKDRPGHDLRYAIDHSKLTNELGWNPKMKFEDGIKSTIDWYRTNLETWKPKKKMEWDEIYNFKGRRKRSG